jgi:hypothetical protein
MGDNPAATRPLDVASVSPESLAALGDSALGHALRRILALGTPGTGCGEPDAIAAHDSHL